MGLVGFDYELLFDTSRSVEVGPSCIVEFLKIGQDQVPLLRFRLVDSLVRQLATP